MASGSFYKEFYSGGSTKYKIIAEWSSSGDYSSNTSNVSVVLKLYCPYDLDIGERTATITIDGSPYSISTPSITDMGNVKGRTITLGSKSKTVSHNSNGDKSISISFSMPINATIGGTTPVNTVSGSGTATLDSLESGESGGDEPTDETYPELYWPTGASNTYYVGDTIKVNVKRYQSGVYSWYLLLRLSDNKYYNMNVSSTNPNGNPRVSTSYSFTIPEDVYNHMKDSLEDEAEINIAICDYASDKLVGWGDDLAVKIKINPDLVKPIISNVSLTNNSVDLTGDENTFIRYVSQATGYFEAAGQKGASITSMVIANGSKTTSYLPGTIEQVESGIFTFTATDSRGLSTTETLTKTLIDYIRLTCNMDIKPPTAEGNLSNATIKGNFYNQNFGGSQNTLTLHYRYRINDEAYGDWITATPTLTGNTYSYSFSMTGLNYQSNYTFQAKAKDALLEVITDELTVRTTPVFDWGENDFQFNVPVKFNEVVEFVDGSTSSGGGADIDLSGYATISYVDNAIANAQLSGGGGGGSDVPAVSGDQKLLWRGMAFPTTSDTITLNEGISQQPNGIVLVFCRCTLTEAGEPNVGDVVMDLNCFFIPKLEVSLVLNRRHVFLMYNSIDKSLVRKIISFKSDTTLSGSNMDNAQIADEGGITFKNNTMCLRYVIGV